MAFLLGQSEGTETSKLWVDCPARTSSLLLQAECLINLRRHALQLPKHAPKEWLKERTTALSECLTEINLKDLDASILELISREEELADCRTLDAIHLATALFFRERSDEDFYLITLDTRMRQTAAKLKLEVLPT